MSLKSVKVKKHVFMPIWPWNDLEITLIWPWCDLGVVPQHHHMSLFAPSLGSCWCVQVHRAVQNTQHFFSPPPFGGWRYKWCEEFGFKRVKPLTAKLFNWNFHPLEVVSRWRDPQLQVNENYSDLTKWRSTLFKSCWLMSHYGFNMLKRRYWMW